MASTDPITRLWSTVRGINQMPAVQQGLLLIGLAASVALGVAVVLWSQKPSMRPLYSHLDISAVEEVLDNLQEKGIRYQLDKDTGTVFVPADQVYQARFSLAKNGLPKNHIQGFEFFDKEQGLGISRFMETARYRHALEGELSRTIANIQKIKAARVHLAIPRESVFVNDKQHPQASVMVELLGGATLSKQEVAAISRLVASSVPNMKSQDVSVVDQMGHLFSGDASSDQLALSKDQFDYQQHIEQAYAKRIETMLSPFMGEGKIRAEVSADIDFTHREQTQESYLPESKILRSEQVLDETKSTSQQEAGGIPGAVANQPMAEGAIPADNNQESPNVITGPIRRQATRNYEVGKMVSHAQLPVGQLKKLSVAVVVDEHTQMNPETKEITRTPLTAQEIEQITMLVKNAVGFNAERGDQISVVSVPFIDPTPIEEAEALPFWQQPWLHGLMKTGIGALLIFLLIFMVLRPAFKTIAQQAKAAPLASFNMGQAMTPMAAASATAGQSGMAQTGQMMPAVAQEQTPVAQLDDLKKMAETDPAHVAQVMKAWMGEGNG